MVATVAVGAKVAIVDMAKIAEHVVPKGTRVLDDVAPAIGVADHSGAATGRVTVSGAVETVGKVDPPVFGSGTTTALSGIDRPFGMTTTDGLSSFGTELSVAPGPTRIQQLANQPISGLARALGRNEEILQVERLVTDSRPDIASALSARGASITLDEATEIFRREIASAFALAAKKPDSGLTYEFLSGNLKFSGSMRLSYLNLNLQGGAINVHKIALALGGLYLGCSRLGSVSLNGCADLAFSKVYQVVSAGIGTDAVAEPYNANGAAPTGGAAPPAALPDAPAPVAPAPQAEPPQKP